MTLTQSLGMRYPILQSGMGGVAGPELAAAVSNAGGLGILAGHGIEPAELEEGLAALRKLTDRPFGVNLILSADLIDPVDPSLEVTEQVNSRVNPLRAEVGLDAKSGLPSEPSRTVLEKLEILIAARVPVLSIGLGNPGGDLVERCHASGIKVIAMVASLEDALDVEAAGVDAIVAQGSEAGGHRSHFAKPGDPGFGLVGSMVLIPEIARSVSIPVIAAGGITDGRGLVAALALGADGAMMGTRFLATQESMANPAYKRAVLDARGSETTITDAASGRYARVIRNRFTGETQGMPTLPFGWQGSAVSELFERARELEDSEHMALWAGQSCGLIDDLPSASEVVARIMEEARGVAASVSLRVDPHGSLGA